MLDLLKSLADPSRLRLVAVLLAGEYTVQELTRIMGMGQSRISRHLKILAEAGVLSVKRQGTWSYYRVGEENPFFTAIRPAFEQELEKLPERGRDLAELGKVLEERRQKSLHFFDRHARQWDTLSRTLLPVPVYHERLLSLVPAGAAVLEIGVGTGVFLPQLAGHSSRVVGVDHSPAMLEEARRRVAEDGVQGVELRLGEMTHLPMEDAGVDCAVANMVLHHAPDPLQVLVEMVRVIRVGGSVVLADLARHEREWVREQLADQWLGFDEEELAGWMETAGLEKVRMERVVAEGREEVLLVRGFKSAREKRKSSKGKGE